MDDEVKGKGNSVSYKYRMHDPRIGRFFAVDPLTWKYPWYTPYQFSGNKVIHTIELEGLEEYVYYWQYAENGNLNAIKDANGKQITAINQDGTKKYHPVQAIYMPNGDFHQFDGDLADATFALRNNGYEVKQVNFQDPPTVGEAVNFVYEKAFKPMGHTALDAIGAIPVIGEVADLVNAGWYALEGDYENAGISALAIIPFIGEGAKIAKYTLKYQDDAGNIIQFVYKDKKDLAAGIKKITGGGNYKAIAKKRKELPSLDSTGKVHGDLLAPRELKQYTKDELLILKSDLEKSVQKRIDVTTDLGRDRPHGQRQGAEQDLIKSIEKHLENK